ncbi:MAG: hypothetical protein UT91_C0017G0015 [Parcubacteria group bacterium GW2011_GWA2_40_23]|nr:MAG: hypothetical protein UT91_C0017G0015 [Parcubacteria group bacterium GW2011_GWA2_40_23]
MASWELEALQELESDGREAFDVRLVVGVAERSADGADSDVAGEFAQGVDGDGIRKDGRVVELLIVIDRIAEDFFVDAWVAEAACADEHATLVGELFEEPGVHDLGIVADAECHDVVAAGAVELDVLVTHAYVGQSLIEGGRQSGDVGFNITEAIQELQTGNHSRDVGEVHRTVLEASVAQSFLGVEVLHHRDEQDAPAREPAFVEVLVGGLLDDETADTRGIAKELVERNRDEVWLHHAQVQSLARAVRGRVEKDSPTEFLRQAHPLKVMEGAGVVALGRVGKELVPGGARVAQHALQRFRIEGQVIVDRSVAHDRTIATGVLTESVHGVVVVGSEQVLATVPQEMLQDANGRTGAAGPDDLIFVGVSMEVGKDSGSGSHDAIHGIGARHMVRVRVAEERSFQMLGPAVDETDGGECGAGPVCVDLARLQLRELRSSEFGEKIR